MSTIARRKQQKAMEKKRLVLILALAVAVALLAFAAVTLVTLYSADYKLTLKGEENITLEFGQSFTDPGVAASMTGYIFGDNSEKSQILVEGTVDPTRIGTYTVTYTGKHLVHTATVTRTVTVVDTVAPVITLTVSGDSFTVPGQPYEEEGFHAEDNYDGDITDRVQTRIEGDQVIYTVSDSSGNVTEERRTIVYGDQTAPDLQLSGQQNIVITAGTAYSEPGFSAVDNADGDITDRVEVDGSVNIYKPGTYTITYKVTDSYGNTTELVRTVTVEGIKQPETVVPGDKIIYLTFDDGPGRYTGKLLNILAQYDVKATFFVVDTGAYGYLDDIVDQGHSIGVHSLTHDWDVIYTSVDGFFADMNAMSDIIYKYTGVRTKLMRFPGGSSNTVSKKYCKGIMTELTQAVQAQGYQYFDWNVDSNDAGGAKTAEEVFNNVVKGVSRRNVSIVLQHDIKGFSVDAVEMIIQWGLANGYTFLPLDLTSPTCHHGVRN